MSYISNTLHCKEIAIQLGIKYNRYYLSKKCNDNVSLDLNIDNNYIDLKGMYCIAIRKLIENIHNTWRITIEISKVIIKEEDTLNIYKNILWRVRAKHNMMNNEITQEDKNTSKKEDNNNKVC